ncbi:MAG TPA: hypothetical protein VM008_20175 [Phycisphaerae bacterium]|nr:hypothetical protein [Phycisphaerae bacterium]
MHRELTYFPARNCYKKKRNGVVYYVGKGSQRDSDENYKRAWSEWEEKLAEMVAEERSQRQVQGLPRMMQAIMADQQPSAGDFEAAGFPMDAAVVEIMDRQQQDGCVTLTHDQLRIMLDKARILPKPAQDTTVRTVGEMTTRFLDTKRQQAKTEQRSVGRFANVETYSNLFRDFTGKDKPITVIDAVILADYHAKQLDAIDADEITSWTGRDRLQVARQFVRFCFELGAIDLPRNIDSKNLTITCTPGEIKPMPIDALVQRVKAATGRLKVELLLMANCGFYQVDAADLKHAEVDWKAGTIKRKRSKTKGVENAPTVTYSLWPTTLQLLRLESNNDGPLVFATKNGLATVRDEITDEGKAVRTDSTAQAYARLQVRVKGDRWPLKSIRKAAATLIGGHPQYGRYAQYFLGQSPENVADAHYVKPNEEQFRECLEWLGKEMGLDTVEGITSPAEKED